MRMELINERGKPFVINCIAETESDVRKIKSWKQKTDRAILNKKGRKYAITTR